MLVKRGPWRHGAEPTMMLLKFCRPDFVNMHGERQDGAAAGNGSAAVATLLPPDFNGTTAGKHAGVDGST